jgi:DNA-binding SARP family transcriptional activator/DNA-binding CsgD family transcriptional regulator
MDDNDSSLRIQLLGGFRLQVGARQISPAAIRGKASWLVKLLALSPSHRLHREEVVDRLWPDLEADAGLNNLHGVLHRLRLTLEPDLVRGPQSSYVTLDEAVLALRAPSSVWVDAEAFNDACADAHGSDDPRAFRVALDLYRGDLLPEEPYVEWVATARECMRQSYLDLLLELAAVHERRSELWAAIGTLNRLVAADPCHEEAHVSLMRNYGQAGRRADALRQYQRLASSLRELDVEPDAESRRVLADIMARRITPARPTVCIVEPSVWGKSMLSGRERDVIGLVSRGFTNRQIAVHLGLSPRTAETHMSRILRKLGVPSREQAAAWAHVRIRTQSASAD